MSKIMNVSLTFLDSYEPEDVGLTDEDYSDSEFERRVRQSVECLLAEIEDKIGMVVNDMEYFLDDYL